MKGTRARRVLAAAACLAIIAGAGLVYLSMWGWATPRLAATPAAPLPADPSAALGVGSEPGPGTGSPFQTEAPRAAGWEPVAATVDVASRDDAGPRTGADARSPDESIDPRAQRGAGLLGAGASGAAPDSLAEITHLVSRTKWISGPGDDVLRAVESLVLTLEASRGRDLGARDLDRQKLAVDRVLEAAAAMLLSVADAEGAALMEEARLALEAGRFDEAEDLIRATVEAYEPDP